MRYLTYDEEKELKRLAKSSDEVTSTHASIVLMSANGTGTLEIASALGVCERTARNVVNMFNKGGNWAVPRKTSPGRPRLLNDEQRDALIALVRTSPVDSGYRKKCWTVLLLLEEAKSRGIVPDISSDTLSREVRRAGIDMLSLKPSKSTDNGIQASGGRGAPAHNTNAVRTGAYTNTLLSDEDRAEHDRVISRLEEMLGIERGIDRVHLEMLAIYWLRLMRALAAGNVDAAERLDRLVRRQLKTLRVTKKEADDGQSGVTPAEWATDLL